MILLFYRPGCGCLKCPVPLCRQLGDGGTVMGPFGALIVCSWPGRDVLLGTSVVYSPGRIYAAALIKRLWGFVFVLFAVSSSWSHVHTCWNLLSLSLSICLSVCLSV